MLLVVLTGQRSQSKDSLLLDTMMGSSCELGLVDDDDSIGIDANLDDSKFVRLRLLVKVNVR